MKDEEKNLIENLFYRLKNTELNSSERDNSAENLIKKLIHEQPNAPYYMTQTMLIQETAIKKMSLKIEELRKQINYLKKKELDKKPSFLSNFFKKNSTPPTMPYDNNIWKKQENVLQSNNANPNIPSTTQTVPISNSRSGGFLSNALQTATGVAGGMILGNMLMNIFSHTRPEDEMFSTINKSSTENYYTEENFFNSNSVNQDNLVDYEHNESDIDFNEFNSNDTHHDVYNSCDGDFNDDNLI